MNQLHNPIASQNVDAISGWLILCIIVGLLVWLWSIVRVATTRTQDPYDRIVWLLIVLSLNIVGTVLYLLFGMEPKTSKPKDYRPLKSDDEIKKRANEGTLI